MIGCGAIADNLIGGVSTTGHGESIARVQLSSRIQRNMEDGMSPTDACKVCAFSTKGKKNVPSFSDVFSRS